MFRSLARLVFAIVLFSPSAALASDKNVLSARPHLLQIAQTDAFQALSGSQITTLFGEIEGIQIPEVGSGWSGADWILDFKAGGSWDATTFTAWGTWRVDGDRLCIAVDDGETNWNSPFEGCFSVHLNTQSGTIAGLFPNVDKDLFIMKENAFGDVARLHPRRKTTQQQAARPPVRPDETTHKKAEQKRELEAERLELERARLALQRQKLALEKEALALKRQQAAVDDSNPVIELAELFETTASSVTVAGSARDNGQITRIEVAGRRVEHDRGTGRFSTTVGVQLGTNRILVSATDASGNKSERTVLVTRKRDIPALAYGAYHAVVIGINDYKSLPKLKTAIADARAVAKSLQEDYGYKVHLLENPTRSDIIDTFDELRERLSEDDNLLIYYAGHGWLDKQSGRGYWLPVNARSDRRSRWVSNADLTDALQALLAKHVMIVADSCYSGTLTRSIKVPERNRAYLERIASKRARVVLSSGGLEPVADSGGGEHSVFAAQFLKALKSNEGVLDGTKLFEMVRQTVVLNADQTPEYSDIRRAGHEGGDFLFVRRD